MEYVFLSRHGMRIHVIYCSLSVTSVGRAFNEINQSSAAYIS